RPRGPTAAGGGRYRFRAAAGRLPRGRAKRPRARGCRPARRSHLRGAVQVAPVTPRPTREPQGGGPPPSSGTACEHLATALRIAFPFAFNHLRDESEAATVLARRVQCILRADAQFV